MKQRRIGCKMFLISTRMLVLIAVIGMSVVAFANVIGTNSVSVVDQAFEVVKSYIPEIKGNAIWDVVKLLFVWGLKLIPASILLLMIVCSLFSQRIHVALFIKGRWRGLFWFSGVKPFGRLVDKYETREYRKFDSPARKRVMNALNAHSGVFLVMGPPGVGKSLMVRAESKAKYVLAVDRDDWYDYREDTPPVKAILKERTMLLVKNLIFKKTVCVVLTWNSTSAIPMPSKYRMEKIVDQLSGILSESKNFRMVSFVLIVPAYYQLDSPQQEMNDYCRMPEEHSVNLLNCSECLGLLDAQLKYKANTDGFDTTRVRRDLNDEARDCGLTLERMVWIESFGKPKQVVGIVGRQQYKSSEVWKSLRDWWKQVYDANNKEEWLSYLYVIALASLVNKSPVDAESLAKKLFGDRSSLVDEALRRICVKSRPAIREEGAPEGGATVRQKAKFSDERPFGLRKLIPELVFEDPYVVESLVGSLGYLLDESGQKIFNFREQMSDAVKKVFLLDDISECKKLADVYMAVTERFPNLSQRLSEQYMLLDRLEEAFGNCKLVEAYGLCLRAPVAFQDFVRAVISRIGALPESMFSELLRSISDTLRENNSSSEYTTLVFEMLPVFVIACKLPHVWNIDFKVLVEEMDDPNVSGEVQFKCAAIICVAYATYKVEELLGGRAFRHQDVQECFGIMKSAFSKVSVRVDSESGHWMFLKQILPMIDTMAQDGSLPIPTLDIEALPSDVRMIWLSLFCKLMVIHGGRTDSDVSMNVVFSISHILHGVELTGNESELIRMYKSQMPYWLNYDVNTEEGIAFLVQDIDDCKREIAKWTDCPSIAAQDFSSLCEDYRYVCNSGVEELWSPDVLWELHGIIHDWQRGMSDWRYSSCLSTFAHLLSCISQGSINVDLQNIWKDFAERVKEFWLPILAGERELEDWNMPYSFFWLYSSLSNVKTIPPSVRVALLQEIIPNGYMYCYENSCPVECARLVHDCDSDILQPHTKLFWCAQLMARKQAPLFSNDSAEMIRVAEELIQEAKTIDERSVDEELMRKLYEANGISSR